MHLDANDVSDKEANVFSTNALVWAGDHGHVLAVTWTLCVDLA